MDKYEAKKLVADTFQNSFDRSKFYYFVKNLLNHFDESKAFHAHGYVKEKFKKTAGIVKTYERLGTYIDPEGNKIDILVVYLEKKNSLDRARTTLRNFVADYLKQRDMKEAALVGFVSPDLIDWRFSLVKMEYKISQTPSGNIKAKEEFTPAKRFSFLVGPEEHTHTAQSRLAPIIQDDINNPTLKELEDAFSIEKVTKEFFEKYRELFLWVKETLDEIVKKDPAIKSDFERKQVKTIDFTKKLLGQIVFLYFLQKKGWFGVERDKDWGTGSKRFLRDLFDGKIIRYKNFFNDVLEPLFYDALARDKSDVDHFNPLFNCKIPFLNGGLFDPIGNYDWVNTDIKLLDELFSNDYKTKEGDTGTGILDIFDRYNFTVKEDEPLEKEVAVDPEMLGKVFENLLEVKDRKSKGTYYTPREIVHYMCQESLINYLITECEGKVSKEDIETLIKFGETAIEHDSRVGQNRRETQAYSYKLPESVRKNAQFIDEKLANIRVCDPAIGSGAFPVGMMNEIIRTRNTLTNYLDDKEARSIYNFKRDAIQNSLYGVDIDPGAVEIAKLRLWLSLVVDEEDIKQIKPLPNLDYKIMQGNSLIEILTPELLVGTTDQEKNELVKQVKKAKDELFGISSSSSKNKKREEIESFLARIIDHDKKVSIRNLESQIASIKNQGKLFTDKKIEDEERKKILELEQKIQEIENLKLPGPTGHFEWHLNFNEVFNLKGGFDVVIANPPYMKERDNKKVFEIVNNSGFGKKFHQGKMDYWYYFLHKAVDLVRHDSVICYITSRYWLNSLGAKKLIERVKEELSFVNFVDIGKLKVFDNVAGQHMIALYVKNKDIDEFIYKKLENDLSDISKNTGTDNLIIKSLKNNLLYSENYEIHLDNSVQNFKNVTNLGDICDISQGVVEAPDKISKKALEKISNPNISVGMGVFVLNQIELESLNLNGRELEAVKKYLDPGDIFRYGIRKNIVKFLLYTDKSAREKIKTNEEFIHLRKHLDRFRKFITSSNRPYGLHRPRNPKYFIEPKIIFKNMFIEPEFTYDVQGSFFGFSFSSIIQKDKTFDLKYVLGILNSKFALHWFQKNGKRRGAGFDIGVEKLRLFPIKKITLQEQKPFIEAVDKILALTSSSDYLSNAEKQARVKDYEKQIDQLVYKLYGLTQDEIKIVEGGCRE